MVKIKLLGSIGWRREVFKLNGRKGPKRPKGPKEQIYTFGRIGRFGPFHPLPFLKINVLQES